ncbi:MAG: hypothetical protein H0U74_05120 [Bradymonadaceae bacterium]|nr:hypothetical protein [Lujinxingiaceae bacterium]
MKKYLVALCLSAIAITSAPTSADAALRLGVDARLIPLGDDSMSVGPFSSNAERQWDSLGFGARGMLGFDVFAVGLKLNFAAHSYSNSDLNYSELGINAAARVGLPLVGLAIFAEGGPAFAFDYGGVGFTVGGGLEYDISPIPLISLNVGIGGQFASVPVQITGDFNREVEGMRFFAFLGADFSL